MFQKIKKLYKIISYFLKDEDNLFLYLMLEKANECLKECFKLDISHTEELEDLIFHIKSYMEIPDVLTELKYPEFKDIKVKDIIKKYKNGKIPLEEVSKYGDFLIDLEQQRAVERDFIFESAKVLTFGFKL